MWFSARKTNTVTDEQAMQQMMLLLDEWEAPDPSPWFEGRMAAQFRNEQQRAPESVFEKLRSRWLFNPQSLLKPLVASTMALLLVAGGGSYWQLVHTQSARPVGISATVEDLQILDNNAQVIQQMDQLLDDNDNDAQPQS